MFHSIIILIVKTIVFTLDVTTLPIHLVLQRPWIRWMKAKAVRAKQLDPLDPYSPWISVQNGPKNFIDDCQTMDEVITKTIEFYGKDKQCFGYRHVINEEMVYSEGKPITKYMLSDYKWITMGQLEERIKNIGNGLLMNGVKSGQNVMIIAETSNDWFICEMSILRIGATLATTYTSLNDQGIIHCINETEVTHVLTSFQLLPRLIKMNKDIPKVSTMIYFNPNNEALSKVKQNSNLRLISLSELEEKANQSSNERQLIHQNSKADDIAVLLYTSGSTGPPKGIKITHRNFVSSLATFKRSVDKIKNNLNNQTHIAYLPLAHIFAQVDGFVSFASGMKIGYSSPNTLTDMGTAIREGDKGDATLLKPMSMVGVPIVLDRIRKGICDKITKKGIIVRKLFDFAVDYKWFWNQRGFDTPLMDRIFCSKFRQSIGGQLSYMIVGGAPLSEETHKIIKSCLNIKLIQVYGTTEVVGAGCMMDAFDQSSGRVGPPLMGRIKLIDWKEAGYRPTDKPNPRGELVVGSESVSVGYYKLNTENQESFYTDPDGLRWFVTGDIGEVFPNGTFKIIDRKKDLIKLQFGEYVSLGKVETELKSNEFIDIICVLGDMFASYLVALIIPNQLSVLRLASSLNIDYKGLTDLYENQTIVRHITDQIKKHGIKARLNKYEIPQKFMLCSDEWSADNGLLTASMKIKRKNIEIKYRKQIDLMFDKN